MPMLALFPPEPGPADVAGLQRALITYSGISDRGDVAKSGRRRSVGKRRLGFLILSAVTLVVAMVVRASPFAGAAAPPDPAVVGQFEKFTQNGVVQDYYQPPSPVIAVHMVLMRNGLVLALGPFKY